MQKNTQSHSNLHTQQELITAIKGNNDHILKQLYSGNFFKVEAYILKNNGNSQQAKDIFQEAFVAVWRNIKQDKFVPDGPSAFEGYLFTVAKNKWMDYLRSAHHRKTTALEQQSTGAMADIGLEEAGEEEEQKLKTVMAAYQQLGDNCKLLITKFYFEKKSLKEIASELELAPASVRNQKYRCMQRLRTISLK